jgi:hypothetical protein
VPQNRCSSPGFSSGGISPASPPGEVLEAIALFCPVWADADLDGIAFAGRRAAHGGFRVWVQLIAHTCIALARTGRPCVDEELLRWVFSRLA